MPHAAFGWHRFPVGTCNFDMSDEVAFPPTLPGTPLPSTFACRTRGRTCRKTLCNRGLRRLCLCLLASLFRFWLELAMLSSSTRVPISPRAPLLATNFLAIVPTFGTKLLTQSSRVWRRLRVLYAPLFFGTFYVRHHWGTYLLIAVRDFPHFELHLHYSSSLFPSFKS